MSVVYRIKDPESGEYKTLVSQEYVDIELKRIKDALNLSLPSVLTDTKVVDLDLNKSDDIKASSVQQDAGHRMVTESQLELFKRKPTMHEIKDEISKAKKYIEGKIEEQYYKLLNTPNAVDRLRKLSSIIQNDDVLSELFKVLDDTITEKEMEEHRNSNKHLTAVDRKSLNLLQTLVNEGLLDNKNKETTSQVAYADKAKDADTVYSKTMSELMEAANLNNLIIGHTDYCCDGDYYKVVKASDPNIDDIINEITKTHIIGLIKFTPGTFTATSINYKPDKDDHCIMMGCGWNSIIRFNTMDLDNLKVRDIVLKTTKCNNFCSLKVSNTTFRDVKFVNCVIAPIENVIFTECQFEKCDFKFSAGTQNVIISNNFFVGCNAPKFSGSSVVINNNF